MKELFASPVSTQFSQKQKTLQLALVEVVPQKNVDALDEAFCMSDRSSHLRQRDTLDCQKALLASPKHLMRTNDIQGGGVNPQVHKCVDG